MRTLIVKTENETAAKLLLAFLKTVRLVKSISLVPDEGQADILQEPEAGYNWLNPSRPATDEEIEKMLEECEKSPLLTSKEAKKRTAKELKEWRAKK